MLWVAVLVAVVVLLSITEISLLRLATDLLQQLGGGGEGGREGTARRR